MRTVKVVKTIDTWEVVYWTDANGDDQEDWELVEMEDLPTPKRRLKIGETPEQKSERMRRTVGVRWEKERRERRELEELRKRRK